MTDLLTAQAAIRARRQVVRDKSGQFTRADAALAARVAAERMKARLLRDADAADHARGVVWEKGHYRKLPGAPRLICVEGTGEVMAPTLFDREAA